MLVSLSSFAQTVKPVEIDFPEDVIDGERAGPDQALVTARPAAKLGSVIKVREDFKDKVLQSAQEL